MKKRFSIKAWIISWAAIGMAGVMIPAATVLIKVTNPVKTVNQQETKVPPTEKTKNETSLSTNQPRTRSKQNADDNLKNSPKSLPSLDDSPSTTDSHLIKKYYSEIQERYEVTNQQQKSLFPTQIINQSSKVTVPEINSWIGEQTRIPLLPNELSKTNESVGLKLHADDRDGTITLKIFVSKKDSTGHYATSGELSTNMDSSGKTVTLSGFAGEKNLIQEQYSTWSQNTTFNVQSNQTHPFWKVYFDLTNLSNESNQTDVISKINHYLPENNAQKLKPLNQSLQARQYQVKLAQVGLNRLTNGQNELNLNLLIQNGDNQVVKEDFSIPNEQSWVGLPIKLTNFAANETNLLNIPIKARFTPITTKGKKSDRLDISFENLITKQQVTWYLKAIVRKNKVDELLKKIENSVKDGYKKQYHHQEAWRPNAKINSDVFAISLNPEEKKTKYDADKLYDLQTNSGANLIAGGHQDGDVTANNKKIITRNNNGMRRHNGNAWRVQGTTGLNKELKNLLSLSTFQNKNDDNVNPFL